MTTPVSTTRNDDWPDGDTDSLGLDHNDNGADDQEPWVPIPAGLLADAVELLGLCDELIGQRRSSCVDQQLRGLLRERGVRDVITAATGVRNRLGSTAGEMAELFDDTGIIVDPTWPNLNPHAWRTS